MNLKNQDYQLMNFIVNIYNYFTHLKKIKQKIKLKLFACNLYLFVLLIK